MGEVPPAFYDASSPDPALWPPKEFIKLPENYKPKKEEPTMTRTRKISQCSRCKLYGHNTRTCKKTKDEAKEDKRAADTRNAAMTALRHRQQREQLDALVELTNSLTERLGVCLPLEVDALGLLFIKGVGDLELEADAAVHALAGAVSSMAALAE